jgi:hypothetical protein
MPKRHLRVVKLLGNIPATGICTFCDRLFTVPFESLKKAADAQWNLDAQFKEHKCKRDGESLALNRVYPTTGMTALK